MTLVKPKLVHFIRGCLNTFHAPTHYPKACKELLFKKSEICRPYYSCYTQQSAITFPVASVAISLLNTVCMEPYSTQKFHPL